MTAMATELINGMNDDNLKPPMLRSVVRDRLPDDKRPFPSHSELSSMLSLLETHELISERSINTADSKLVDSWKEAVDSWVERIISLASSSSPDKCWAGISFIGLTCEQCSSDRFQSSYSIWFEKLVENIQTASSTHFIRASCCASLDDLFKRLHCFPNLKKEGTLLARKLAQPVLQMINEDCGETLWNAAVDLLYTLISLFSPCMQHHFDHVEAVLTSYIIGAKCNSNLSKKVSCCLAMLPKVKGVGDSWHLLMQKFLIAINSFLNDAFQELEEEKQSLEVFRTIVRPGVDPPPPLGAYTFSGEATESSIRRLRELLVPRVSTLMHSCCAMLITFYPFSVFIPVRPLLATVYRVLQVDGSFSKSLFPLATSMHQELLCAELPFLHLASLHLLGVIIKCLRGQLLPHGDNITRFITKYFERAKIPSIRLKLYSIGQTLLISLGYASTMISQELIRNAFDDLTNNSELETRSMFSNSESSIARTSTFQQNFDRKRKRTSALSTEHPSGVDLSIKACGKKPQAPLSVKIAALEALKALITIGGSLKSASWRPEVDRLVANVATNACEEICANEDMPSSPRDEPSFTDFQLAALETLLASLLSPVQTRPPYLSQSLDLFRRGKLETGSRIATFSACAILSLKHLLHPRAPHLEDLGPKNILIAGFNHQNAAKLNRPSFFKNDREFLEEDENEELPISLFDKSSEKIPSEIPRPSEDEHIEATNQLSKASTDIKTKTFDVYAPEHENVDKDMECLSRDDTITDKIDEEEESWRTDENHPLNVLLKIMDVCQEIPTNKSDSFLPVAANSICNVGENTSNKEDVPERFSDYKAKDAKLSYDSGSDSLNSLPSIVDGDPDSE